MTEKIMTDEQFNMYLLQYSKKYKVGRQFFMYRGEQQTDNIRVIKCKFGSVQPNDMYGKKLLFEWGFPTIQKTSYFVRNLPDYCEITQGGKGSSEGVLFFPKDKLDDPIESKKLEKVFKIVKRRVLTEKTKEMLRERLKVLNQNKVLKNQ